MRLDKYLKVSRLIKRRSVANDACDGERVSVNGRQVKAGYQVKTGDVIEIAFGQRTLKVEVNIQEVTLDRSEVYLLKEDALSPIQLAWSVAPLDADDLSVRFESDNEQVAQVTKDGLVTMTGGYGTAVITASSDSGASASFVVNVVTQLPEAEPEPTQEAAQGVYADYNAEDDGTGDEITGSDALLEDDGFSESDLYEDNIYGETPPPGVTVVG